MKKFEALSAWFFTMLGAMLILASVLVVPERAFADPPTSCSDACCQQYYPGMTCDTESSEYSGCITDCSLCEGNCNNDPECIDDCYAQPLQCQTLVVAGKAAGCVSPGKACDYAGKPSSCTVIISNNLCHCPP